MPNMAPKKKRSKALADKIFNPLKLNAGASGSLSASIFGSRQKKDDCHDEGHSHCDGRADDGGRDGDDDDVDDDEDHVGDEEEDKERKRRRRKTNKELNLTQKKKYTASLFDASTAQQTHRDVAKRRQSHMAQMKKKKRREQMDCDLSPQLEESRAEELLERRREQSRGSLVDTISHQWLSPQQQQQQSSSSVAPRDVQLDEVASTLCTYGVVVVRSVWKDEATSLLPDLSQAASDIYAEICETLLRDHNIDFLSTDPESSFRFQEVASRCRGRMDVRYKTEQAPFASFLQNNVNVLEEIVSIIFGGSASANGGEFSTLHTGAASSNSLVSNGDSDNGSAFRPKLLYAGLIYSRPGSDNQPWHQDGVPLFPELHLGRPLPTYALNIFIPLSDDDAGSVEAGPTEFIPCSHTMAASDVDPTKQRCGGEKPSIVSPLLKAGDVLIYDFRTCHRGTANVTTSSMKPRRILYLLYARPWFSEEHINFGTDRLFS